MEIRNPLVAGLAGAATEIIRHGFTPRGIIGATAAGFMGASYTETVHDKDIVDMTQGFFNKETLTQAAKSIAVSYAISLIANGIFHFVAAQLTLGGSLALAVPLAALAYHYWNSDSMPVALVSGLTALMAAETAGMIASKYLAHGAGVVSMTTGLYGLAVSVILGTYMGYSAQQPVKV